MGGSDLAKTALPKLEEITDWKLEMILQQCSKDKGAYSIIMQQSRKKIFLTWLFRCMYNFTRDKYRGKLNGVQR